MRQTTINRWKKIYTAYLQIHDIRYPKPYTEYAKIIANQTGIYSWQYIYGLFGKDEFWKTCRGE